MATETADRADQQTSAGRRAVILTALRFEYAAVRDLLKDLQEFVGPTGTVYERGTLQGDAGEWEVILAEIGAGNADAALRASRVIEDWTPTVLLLVGVAGGLKNVSLGDVVVANKVYGYAPATNEGDFAALPPVSSTYRMEQRARAEARKGDWLTRIIGERPASPPRVFVSPLAAVDRIVHKESDVYRFLRSEFRDAVAVEMEGYGFLSAVQSHPQIEALVVRGVADLITDQPTKEDGQRENAARNASAFALTVLSRLVPSAGRTTPRPYVQRPMLISRAYLTGLSVQSIRALDKITWSINPERGPGWHVLIGNNGAGKTSFLRAIALSVMGEDDAQALRQDWSAWLRHRRPKGEIRAVVKQDPSALVQIGSSGNTRPTEVKLKLTRQASPDGGAPGLSSVSHSRQGTPPSIFSVAYGPFRRLSGGDPELERELASYPRALRHITLFSERAALAESLAWLKYLDHRRHERGPEGEFLDVLIQFINQPGFLPNGTMLADVSADAVTFKDGNGYVVSIEELSDGFRSILSLTLDLLRQMETSFGPEGVFAPRDPTRVIASGIVLIDEVDAHLHPTWQREVGMWFRRLFPYVQFIVTSHSPLVCQAAEHGTVFLLPRPGLDEKGRMLTGVELDRVRYGNVLDAYGTGVFGHGVTRSETSKQMLRELAELNHKEIDAGLTKPEQKRQIHLRAILGTSVGVMETPD